MFSEAAETIDEFADHGALLLFGLFVGRVRLVFLVLLIHLI